MSATPIIAYNTAYRSYHEVFGKQKESDKARAELFVSVAALLPGSILMATAASSSLRVIANRAALRLLSQRSATRTLAVYNTVASNATASFAIGKALDIVKDETGKVIKDAVTRAMSNSQDLLSTDPMNRDKQFNSWLINHKLLAFDAAAAIEASRSMSASDKERAYEKLRAAPIANKPSGKLDPARLAPKLELGFCMIWLLESDTLVTEIIPSGPDGIGGRYTSTPIQEMPSSNRFPRGNTDRNRGKVQWVAVNRPGGDVEHRIDTLNRQLRGKQFPRIGRMVREERRQPGAAQGSRCRRTRAHLAVERHPAARASGPADVIVPKAAASLALPLVLLTACGSDAQEVAPHAGEALAQIREQVEGQRQCAPLLSGSAPIELSADALASPRVDALVAAGLVRRVPLPDSGDRPRVRIEPTAAGLRDIWMRRLDPNSPAEPLLCYGRKHVVAVRAERRDIGAETGATATGEVIRYDYRVVQPPSWALRPDIRAAFPFLARELERVRTAEQAASSSSGRWRLPADTGRDASAELASEEGFFPNLQAPGS